MCLVVSCIKQPMNGAWNCEAQNMAGQKAWPSIKETSFRPKNRMP